MNPDHHPEHGRPMDPESHKGHALAGDRQMAGQPPHDAHRVADFRQRFWLSLALTIPILALSPVVRRFLGLEDILSFPGDLYLLFALSSFVFFYGGGPFLKGIVTELKARRPGMMTLVAVAITTAYVYGCAVVLGLPGEIFFWELATLIDIMLLGHWLEMRSVAGASRALEELARLMPSEAHLVRPDGSATDVPLSALRPGDRVLVKPGEKMPADGDVIEGESSVNEAMLTGESRPAAKAKGARVIGGSINVEGSITVEIERTGSDSYLSQVIGLVRQAQASKSKTQDLSNRAALWLTLIAIGVGALTLTSWLVLSGRGSAFALERMVTVMVIACPHALGLAVPLVVAVSTAISAGMVSLSGTARPSSGRGTSRPSSSTRREPSRKGASASRTSWSSTTAWARAKSGNMPLRSKPVPSTRSPRGSHPRPRGRPILSRDSRPSRGRAQKVASRGATSRLSVPGT